LLAKSEVKEWLAITILQCAMASNDTNDTKNDTKKKNADLKKAVSVISSKLNLNVNGGVGPWKNSFTEIWTLVHAQLFNDTKSNAEKESLLETWSQYWGLLSKEQQSAWMDAKADVMVAQKKNAEAAFFLKQSHDLMPSKNLGDRIQNLLGLKPEITKTPNNLSPQPEQDLDDQIQKLSADGKMLEAQALMIESMKQFPQGKNARRYKDRALEIYFAQNKDHQDAALKNLLAADSSRQIEWAQSLHRRGDFKAALSLTEKILPQHLESPQAASLLWLAGRSAQFLGDYDKAIKYFDELVQKHSANDDALEAQFRLGLIQYRKENFLLAATYFDRVRNANRDRYELNAWYWMIRSFEKEKDARAVTERDLLISRYPFSYYGLRLRAEKQEGVISFPEVENETAEPVATLSLLPTQWAAWKRFKLLAENGWILEAQQELATLPQPVSSAALWKWMQLLSKAQQSLAVITLTNHLMDQDANFRRPEVLWSMDRE
jgi:soluble lytic murein transglycosylase